MRRLISRDGVLFIFEDVEDIFRMRVRAGPALGRLSIAKHSLLFFLSFFSSILNFFKKILDFFKNY